MASDSTKLEWDSNKSSKGCVLCSKPWGTFKNRRHHCRKCGRLVCESCSQNRYALEESGDKKRVCDHCYLILTKKEELKKEVIRKKERSAELLSITSNISNCIVDVFYLDGSFKTLSLDPNTDVAQLSAQVCFSARVALFEVKQNLFDPAQYTLLQTSQNILDIFKRWEDEDWHYAKLVVPLLDSSSGSVDHTNNTTTSQGSRPLSRRAVLRGKLATSDGTTLDWLLSDDEETVEDPALDEALFSVVGAGEDRPEGSVMGDQSAVMSDPDTLSPRHSADRTGQPPESPPPGEKDKEQGREVKEGPLTSPSSSDRRSVSRWKSLGRHRSWNKDGQVKLDQNKIKDYVGKLKNQIFSMRRQVKQLQTKYQVLRATCFKKGKLPPQFKHLEYLLETDSEKKARDPQDPFHCRQSITQADKARKSFAWTGLVGSNPVDDVKTTAAPPSTSAFSSVGAISITRPLGAKSKSLGAEFALYSPATQLPPPPLTTAFGFGGLGSTTGGGAFSQTQLGSSKSHENSFSGSTAPWQGRSLMKDFSNSHAAGSSVTVGSAESESGGDWETSRSQSPLPLSPSAASTTVQGAAQSFHRGPSTQVGPQSQVLEQVDWTQEGEWLSSLQYSRLPATSLQQLVRRFFGHAHHMEVFCHLYGGAMVQLMLQDASSWADSTHGEREVMEVLRQKTESKDAGAPQGETAGQQLLLHVYAMASALDDVFLFVTDVQEDWRCKLRLWLLRMFACSVRLPVTEPEMLSSAVDCLRREDLHCSEEVLTSLERALDAALLRRVPFWKGLFGAEGSCDRSALALKYQQTRAPGSKLPKGVEIPSSVGGTPDFEEDPTVVEAWADSVLQDPHASSTCTVAHLLRVAVALETESSSSTAVDSSSATATVVSLVSSNTSSTMGSGVKEDPAEKSKNALTSIKGWLGVSGGTTQMLAVGQYLDNLLDAFQHIVGDWLGVLPVEWEVLTKFQRKAFDLIKNCVRPFYDRNKQELLPQQSLWLLRFLEKFSHLLEKFGGDKVVLLDFLQDFAEDVQGTCGQRICRDLKKEIKTILIQDQRNSALLTQAVSSSNGAADDSTVTSDTQGEKTIGEDKLVSGWPRRLLRLLRKVLGWIPKDVSSLLELHFGTLLLDTLSDVVDAQQKWLSTAVSEKYSAMLVQKLSVFVNNQYSFVFGLNEAVDLWAGHLDDQHLEKIANQLAKLSDQLLEGVAACVEVMSQVAQTEVRDALRAGLFKSGWENDIGCLLGMKDRVKKTLLRQLQTFLNAQLLQEKKEEILQLVLIHCLEAVVAFYLEAMFVNYTSISMNFTVLARLGEDLEVLTQFAAEVKGAIFSAEAGQKPHRVYLSADKGKNGSNGAPVGKHRWRLFRGLRLRMGRRNSARSLQSRSRSASRSRAGSEGGAPASPANEDPGSEEEDEFSMGSRPTPGAAVMNSTANTNAEEWRETSVLNRRRFDDLMKPLTHVNLAMQMSNQFLPQFVKNELYQDFGLVSVNIWQLIMFWRGEGKDSIHLAYETHFRNWSPLASSVEPLVPSIAPFLFKIKPANLIK